MYIFYSSKKTRLYKKMIVTLYYWVYNIKIAIIHMKIAQKRGEEMELYGNKGTISC